MQMIDHQLAEELMRHAGSLAMEHFRKVTPSLKKDKTLVTDADLAVQTYLMGQFVRRFPSVGVVGEEDHLRKLPTQGETYFVIDPIDGTASFVSGLPVWGIAVGVIENLQPVEGYFYMPATGDFFYTTAEGHVFRNDSRLQPITPNAMHRESLLLTVSRFHRKFSIRNTYPGKVRSLGSTIAHICYAATGSADAALVSDIHIWDLAAGLAMARLNGAVAQHLDGDAFVLNESMLGGQIIDSPVLVGQSSVVQEYGKIISSVTENGGATG